MLRDVGRSNFKVVILHVPLVPLLAPFAGAPDGPGGSNMLPAFPRTCLERKTTALDDFGRLDDPVPGALVLVLSLAIRQASAVWKPPITPGTFIDVSKKPKHC